MKRGCNTNVSIAKYDVEYLCYRYQREILKRHYNFRKETSVKMYATCTNIFLLKNEICRINKMCETIRCLIYVLILNKWREESYKYSFAFRNSI